jgi:hypothetical protein
LRVFSGQPFSSPSLPFSFGLFSQQAAAAKAPPAVPAVDKQFALWAVVHAVCVEAVVASLEAFTLAQVLAQMHVES